MRASTSITEHVFHSVKLLVPAGNEWFRGPQPAVVALSVRSRVRRTGRRCARQPCRSGRQLPEGMIPQESMARSPELRVRALHGTSHGITTETRRALRDERLREVLRALGGSGLSWWNSRTQVVRLSGRRSLSRGGAYCAEASFDRLWRPGRWIRPLHMSACGPGRALPTWGNLI